MRILAITLLVGFSCQVSSGPAGNYLTFQLSHSAVAFPGSQCSDATARSAVASAISSATLTVSLTASPPPFNETTVVSPLGGRMRLFVPVFMQNDVGKWIAQPDVPPVPHISALSIMDSPGILELHNADSGLIQALEVGDSTTLTGYAAASSSSCWYNQNASGPVINLPDGSTVGVCYRAFADFDSPQTPSFDLSLCRDKPVNRQLFTTWAIEAEKDGTYNRFKSGQIRIPEFSNGWLPAGDGDRYFVTVPVM